MLLNPRVHESSSLVLARQVLQGVLPQLFGAVRRGRLSDFLSHPMKSTRREIQSLNAMGFAPRGRPGKPLERIEVDLSLIEEIVGTDTSDWSYFAYVAEVLPDTPSQVVH